MSRGAVKASKEKRKQARQLAALEAWFKRVDQHKALDAVLITCDTCGLEQVSPGPNCVICGSESGWFSAYIN